MKNETIIHGTGRPEDLIPAFIEAAGARLEAVSFEKGADAPERIRRHGELQDELGAIEQWAEAAGYFDSEASMHDLETLFNILNELAPEGCYFGAHEGDGSDFGFWEAEEDWAEAGGD